MGDAISGFRCAVLLNASPFWIDPRSMLLFNKKKLTLKRASFFFEPSLNLEQTDSQLREGLPLIGQNFGK